MSKRSTRKCDALEALCVVLLIKPDVFGPNLVVVVVA